MVVLVSAAGARAQDVQVRASVNADKVGIEDQLQYTITISGADAGEAEAPRVILADFQILSGPNVSTQFQWINGLSSSSKSISYVLMPRKQGNLVIESALISVRGKTFRTEPMRVQVTAGSTGRSAARPRVIDPFGPDEPQRSGSRVAAADVFLTAELDRTSAYPGQQVTLSYHLYTRIGVSGLQLQESPPLNGFWVEDLEVPSNPAGNRRVIDGQEYVEYTVKKQALFPTSTGRLTIPAATFAISVKTPGDFFGFFAGSETVYRKSREASLEVKSLPAQGRPPGFGSAVGAFNLSASLDKTTAATGEAVSLRIKLEGRGNLKMIPDLAVPPIPEFTVFSSKRQENVRPFEGGVIGGERTWEYVIVAKAPGQQSIPALTFSYFDPQQEKYETLTTPPLLLTVVRGAEGGSSGAGLSGVFKQNLTRQGADINFIKLTADDLQPAPRPVYQSVWFYLLAVIPVAFNIGVLIYQRERSRQSVDVTRSRKARRLAQARLKDAMRAGRREPRLFYDQAAATVSGYLSDRFRIPEIAVTGDRLERTLTEKSIPPETVKETISCIQECDFGRFVSSSAENMRVLAERIGRVLDLLERAS